MELHRNYLGYEGTINLSDRLSFDTAYRSYFQPLRFYASKFISKDDAEDIIENLFLKLWNKQKEFKSAVHLQAFLYHAIKNACLDYLRVSKTSRTDELTETSSIADNDHLRYMIQAEAIAEIYREVNELPSQCSKVIKMGYLDGMNNEEIARELGLSQQTVKNHKVRGLGILRQKLNESSFMLFLLLFCK